MYNYEIQPHLKKLLSRLFKKDKNLYKQIIKKIGGVLDSCDVENYKNLRHDMKDRKRVHVGHFVLVFKFVKEENKIIFVDFDHHDKIYKK